MGCKSSKDVQAPSNKKSPQKQRQRSPMKSPSKSIKQVSDEQLKDHKLSDIISFIKVGKIEMVKGLIDYNNLGLRAMNIKVAQEEEANYIGGKKESMIDYNPLLVAIAHKRVDIVIYFLQILQVSLKSFGRHPRMQPNSEQTMAEMRSYSLLLAIANKDLPMLEELWSVYQCWELIELKYLVEVLVAESWGVGLQTILTHKTTEIILSTLSLADQVDTIQAWYTLRKSHQVDIHKFFDEALQYKPYTLISFLVLLADSNNSLITNQEIAHFIEKYHANIDINDYFHLKYSNYGSQLIERLNNFEKIGQTENTAVRKLRTHFEKLEKENSGHKYFANLDAYEKLKYDIEEIFLHCDEAKLSQLVELIDIRRLPYTQGNNYNTRSILNQQQKLFWTPAILMIWQAKSDSQTANMIRQLANSGFSLRKAFQMQEDPDREIPQYYPNSVYQGGIIHLAFEKKKSETIKELFSEDFLEVWRYNHISDILSNFEQFQAHSLLPTILGSITAANIFISLPEAEKINFINQVTYNLQYNREAKAIADEVLSKSPYASYLLLNVIEKDNFRKLEDFSLYQRCLDNTSLQDLEEMSRHEYNENQFMGFLRYVTAQDEKDRRKVEGQKLINKIYEIEKFKPFTQNRSLAILDNDSRIWEEDKVEEQAMTIHINNIDAHRKVQIKDINFQVLLDLISKQDSQGAITFLKTYPLHDILYIRGSPDQSIIVSTLNGYTYSNSQFSQDKLNILQLALSGGLIGLVRYIMKEHQILTSSKQIRVIDPRIILLNSSDESDETFTLRLALNRDDWESFEFLWGEYTNIFGFSHLREITRYLNQSKRMNRIYDFLNIRTTQILYQRATNQNKEQFFTLIKDKLPQNDSYYNYVLEKLEGDPYDVNQQQQLTQYTAQTVYQAIKDNESEQLMNQLIQYRVNSIANIEFQFLEEDYENVLDLAQSEKVRLVELTPIQLAIIKKSHQVIKELVAQYGLRDSLNERKFVVSFPTGDELEFSNVLLPLILKTKDNDILTNILKHDGFFLRETDLLSFVQGCIIENWPAGLKTFLWSSIVQLVYQNYTEDGERNYVDSVLNFVENVPDERIRKAIYTQVVEETFTKKPYCKQFTRLILENNVSTFIDSAKALAEMRKSLTAEDLMQLGRTVPQLMSDYEKKNFGYQNQNANPIEKEISFIISRYVNEGKQENNFYSNEQKKQVRFGSQ